MNNSKENVLSLIKKGFFLGIGFIIPLLVIDFISIHYSIYESKRTTEEIKKQWTIHMGKMFEDEERPAHVSESTDAATVENVDSESSESDLNAFERTMVEMNKSYKDDIKLSDYESKFQGTQLLITGQLTNKSQKKLGGIQLEAELFNAGKFVYECSKYISEKIAPEQTENYMMTCGCKNGLPEHDEIKVKVVEASRY